MSNLVILLKRCSVMIIRGFDTEIGKIHVAESDNKIFRLFLPVDTLPGETEVRATPLLREAEDQIKAYLKGKLKAFSLPLNPQGTSFMKNVWKSLLLIPYGEMSSYQEIAEEIGAPKACRAVGLANNRNPIPILIPCHRVVGKNGALTGYRGGLEIKKALLALEAAFK